MDFSNLKGVEILFIKVWVGNYSHKVKVWVTALKILAGSNIKGTVFVFLLFVIKS